MGASCSANKKLSFWASRRRPRLARRLVCSAASRRAWAPPSAPRASGAGRWSQPRALPLASPGRARMPPRHTSATAGRGGAGRDGALEVLTSSSPGKSRDPGRGGGGKGCGVLNPLLYQRSSGSPGLCLPGAAPPFGESQHPQLPASGGLWPPSLWKLRAGCHSHPLPGLPLPNASKMYYSRRLSQP